MSNEIVDVHEQVGRDEGGIDTSMSGLNMNESGEHEVRTDEDYAATPLTIRAIVSSKEAGVIIGKQGKNVADLRDETGVKAGVSKVVQGVHDRVLSIGGPLDGIAKAYGLVTTTLIENPPSVMTSVPQGQHPVRLLISHNQMGTIIGRQGLKIKHIQDVSGARMLAQKEMLPQSTERIVEIQGDPDAIAKAVWEIGKCLIDDSSRGAGTVLYNPAVRAPGATPNGALGGGGGYVERGARSSYARTGNGADFSDSPYRRDNGMSRGPMDRTSPVGNQFSEDGEEIQTQNISIPADMVGCIIGRGGTKIQEIRKTSGARISIAKNSHDESGERMFTITGTGASNEKALYLLYENLEAEKLRRNTMPVGSPE